MGRPKRVRVPGIPTLTPRQTEIITLYAKGLFCKEISRELGISYRTVEVLMLQAKLRIGARSTSHAVAIAVYFGLVQFDPNSMGVEE